MANNEELTAHAVDYQNLTPEEAAGAMAKSPGLMAALGFDEEIAPPEEQAEPQPKQQNTPEQEETAEEPDDSEDEGEEEEAEETEESEDDNQEDKGEAEEADADPEFELEDSDGNTQTVKASEMAQAWRDFQTLETQRAEVARRVQALEQREAEIPRQVSERVRERENELARAIQQWSQGTKAIEPPNPDLLDVNHPDYEPEQFYAQQARYERQQAEFRRAANELQSIAQQRQQEMQERQREQGQKLVEAWPEIKDDSVRAGLYNFLSTNYGLTEDEVNGVEDFRLFLLARDAMKGSKMKAELPKVRQKVKALPPKPTRKQARDASTGQFVKTEDKKARSRLKESGKLDDAAAAFLHMNL